MVKKILFLLVVSRRVKVEKISFKVELAGVKVVNIFLVEFLESSVGGLWEILFKLTIYLGIFT
jgi:hypothetical protein